MSEKVLMKGTEAVAEAAIRAGCRFFAGYPITPQNEMPEYMSRRLPTVNGVFIQGESEVASINMVYGAAAAGVRCMTSSSSCGISLKSEGISFLAGARLPSVVANFQRGGPGIGSIQPAQQDYFQATKASGNGGFRMLVFAPSTLQEAVDMTYRAFDLADKYRSPVYLLLDGFLGTMMETVELPEPKTAEELNAYRESKIWRARGNNGGEPHNVLCGPGLSTKLDQEILNIRDNEMYALWEKEEIEYEEYYVEDAEIILTAYGISARIARSAVSILREEGMKVGFIRPMKVSPFPVGAFQSLDYSRVRAVLCAEMSIPAQYAVDVSNAVRDRAVVDTVLTSGGNILDREAIIEKAKQLYVGKDGKIK